jgi:lipocalin-like protein
MISLGLLVVAVFSPALGQERSQVVGTWRLVSVMYEDQDSKAMTPVFGERPSGYQIATPEGLWMAIVTGDGRSGPKTEAERAHAFASMLAYAGHYRVEGNKLTTKVEVAWNEGMVGSEQVRYLRFEGDKMFVESPFMPNPNGNKSMIRAIVTWQRDQVNPISVR